MKKLIILLIACAFVVSTAGVGFANPLELSKEEERIGVIGLMSVPLLVASTTTAGACIGAPEVALPLLTVYGHYKWKKGDWGEGGALALNHCEGENMGGNCSHLELSKFQKEVYLAKKNGTNVVKVSFVQPTQKDQPSEYSKSLIAERTRLALNTK